MFWAWGQWRDWWTNRRRLKNQGRRQRRRLGSFEPLESRQMLAVTASLTGSALFVSSNAADTITVSTVAGNVKVNGIDPVGGPIARAALTGLTVSASGNFDNAVDLTGLGTASPSLLASVAVSLGDGNDAITLGPLQTGSLLLGAGTSIGDIVTINGPVKAQSLTAFGNTIVLGDSVYSSSFQAYTGATLLTADVTLDTGTNSAAGVFFSGPIDSQGGARSLAIYSAGLTRFSADIGATTPLANLTTAAGGQTVFGGNTIRTTGAARFGDPVVFNANTTIDSDGAIAFGQTLTGNPAGANSLLLFASTGIALESHPTSSGLLSSFSGVTLGGPISTPGNLPPTAVAPVTLNANEDQGPISIDLGSLFADDFEPDAHLAYAVVSNSNSSLLPTTTYLASSGHLLVSLAAHANGSGSLTIRATDAGQKFVDATVNVNVAAVNDAPVNQVPTVLHANVGMFAPLVGLSVSDVDAGTAPVSVTLSVPSGMLEISAYVAGGVTLSQVQSVRGSTITILAPLAAINTTLSIPYGLTYFAPYEFGTTTLTMTTNDLGNSGGAALTDVDTVSVVIGLKSFEVTPGRWEVIGEFGMSHDVVINHYPGGVVTYSAFNYTRTLTGVTSFEYSSFSANSRALFYDHAGVAETYSVSGPVFEVSSASGPRFYIITPSIEIHGETADTALVHVRNSRTTIGSDVLDIGTFHAARAIGFNSVWVYGNADSEITFTNQPGRDVAYLAPGNSSIVRASGAFAVVVGVERVIAHGDLNDGDIAVFYDTPGNDSFTSTPTFAQLLGPGLNATANSFRYVFAFANPGRDIATMYDSPGNDVFFGLPTTSALMGSNYFVQTIGFDAAVAVAGGGVDLAYLYDSPETDYFYGAPEINILSNPNYYNQAFRFDYVWAYAIAGGHDFAYITGSDATNDLTGSGNRFSLLMPNVLLDLHGFDEVHVTTPSGSVVRRNTAALSYLLRTAVQTA